MSVLSVWGNQKRSALTSITTSCAWSYLNFNQMQRERFSPPHISYTFLYTSLTSPCSTASVLYLIMLSVVVVSDKVRVTERVGLIMCYSAVLLWSFILYMVYWNVSIIIRRARPRRQRVVLSGCTHLHLVKPLTCLASFMTSLCKPMNALFFLLQYVCSLCMVLNLKFTFPKWYEAYSSKFWK